MVLYRWIGRRPMPTPDKRNAISIDEARHRAGLNAFPDSPRNGRPGGIGLEPEYFPIIHDRYGRPKGRLLLTQPEGTGVLEIIDDLAASDDRIEPRSSAPPGPVEYPIRHGGRLTFEPGAQVEHSTAVYQGVTAAIADVADVMGRVRQGFKRHDVVLAAVGVDIWNDVETVPQQLRAGRYTAQAAYYRQRGHWGAVMMRHTARGCGRSVGCWPIWRAR